MSVSPSPSEGDVRSCSFQAGVERSGPLSWAQEYMWRAVSLPGNGSAMDFRIGARPRPGTSVETAIACLSTLVERHPALRTCVETGEDGRVRQRVLGSGSIPVHVVHAPDPPRDLDVLAMLPPADGSPPVRALVSETAGQVTYVALRLSHVVADEWGVKLIEDDLVAELATPSGSSPSESGATTTSVDVADYEGSSAGQLANARALAYLGRQLRGAPQTMFPHRPLAGEQPRYWTVELRSRASLLALAKMVTEGMTSSGPVTGLFAGVMAARASLPAALVYLMSGNRTYRWQHFSGPMLQDVPLCIPVAGTSRAELIKDVSASVLEAYHYGRHSPRELEQCETAVEQERGMCLDKLFRTAAVNFHVSSFGIRGHAEAGVTTLSAGSLRDLMRLSTVTSTPRLDLANVTFFLDVSVDQGSLVLSARVDTHMVSLAESAAILRAMEDLMCWPGEDDVPAGDFRQLYPGIDRGLVAGTRIIDQSRIDLDECAEVVARHPDVCRVRLALDHAAAPVITAHIHTRTRHLDPGALHRFVVAGLPHHPLAMAPHRYRLYSSCPGRPDDVAEWEREPELASGTGRP